MRRSGRTTRLVDKAIQCFFEEGAIFTSTVNRDKDLRALEGTKYHPYRKNVVDIVFIDGDSIVEQRFFLSQFLRRLSFEHGMVYKRGNLPIGRVLRFEDFEQGKENKYYLTFRDVIRLRLNTLKIKLYFWLTKFM